MKIKIPEYFNFIEVYNMTAFLRNINPNYRIRAKLKEKKHENLA